jgi:methylaspartate mutase sigma subunit
MQVSGRFKGTLVTGVIGDDVHVIGIRILEHALRDAGFKVVSLGGQVSQEEFINAAIETKADAILVSSLSGHAKLFASGLRAKCVEAGLTDILLYLGGQLLTHDLSWQDVAKMYQEAGFRRVYPSNVKLSQVIADLESDLEYKGGQRGN